MKRYSYKAADLRESYNQQGFVVVDNLGIDRNIQELNRCIHQLFASWPSGKFSTDIDLNNNTTPKILIGDELPHKSVRKIYSHDRKFYNQCWDAIRLAPQLLGLCNESKLITMLHNLGVKQPLLEIYPAVRIDLPSEIGRVLPWHQEWPYGFGSLNSLTVWIALMDINKDQGGLRVIPGSHKFGLLPTVSSDNIISAEVPTSALDESSAISVELKEGEAVVISSFLLHSSGNNVSDQCRYSAQIRYNDASCPYFKSNGWLRSFKIEGMTNVQSSDRNKNIVFRSYD